MNAPEQHILILRGHRIMLSSHLANLYQVQPKILLQAVKRNLERFPPDFMFQLTWEELATFFPSLVSVQSTANPRSQFVTLESGSNIKYLPYAFTEQGIAMLSSVLRSPRAIQVNIEIMRAFVKLRQLLAGNVELAKKMEAMEQKYDGQFRVVFDAIRELMNPSPSSLKQKIGFRTDG